MKTNCVKIKLSRKNQLFEAAVGMVKGNLDQLTPHLNLLHEEEQMRYDSMNFKRRRLSYLLGRYSAKSALTHLRKDVSPNRIWIDSGIFHFPVVKCSQMPNAQLSISHCSNIGITAAFPEAHPIGLDLEKICESKIKTFLNQTTDDERALLSKIGLDNIVGYTGLWTIKETLSKVIKTGMTINFGLLEVGDIEWEDGILKSSFKHFKQYHTYTKINDPFSFSLTFPKKTKVNLDHVWEILPAKTMDLV